MTTIDGLIEMKKQKMAPFQNKYEWLIMNIEDILLSKSNPRERISELIEPYQFDGKAKLMIFHQFYKVDHQCAKDIYAILGYENCTAEQTYVEDKYANELLECF